MSEVGVRTSLRPRGPYMARSSAGSPRWHLIFELNVELQALYISHFAPLFKVWLHLGAEQAAAMLGRLVQLTEYLPREHSIAGVGESHARVSWDKLWCLRVWRKFSRLVEFFVSQDLFPCAIGCVHT